MPWRKKGSFYDTTRDFWQIQQMMDEEDERRENWNRDHADFCDDLDEFGEDTNEDLGFESDFDDDTLLGLDDDSCTWRKENSDYFSEYNLDPEDYATEEEFLEALEDVKAEWRENYHDAFLEYSVDPDNFETEEEFLEVLEEAKTAWRREYADAFLEYHIDPNEFKTEDEFLEVLEEAKTAWREQYSEAKTEYNLDPEDYETEDEFQSELEHRVEWMERWKAKAEKYNLCLPYYETEEEFVVDYMLYWREELQEKADDYGMNIEDYETDDDFLKAYETVKAERIAMGAESPSGVPELDAIDPKKYRDMDTYRAAYRLKEAEIFSDCTLSDHEKYIYQLMVERPFPQGKYLDDIFGFRYNEAIADNLNLPVGIDKEDLADERSITDLIAYIDRVDEEFSFTAWKWCVDTFWPYCKYNDYLVYGVLYELNSLTESFRTSLINEICSNQVLRSSIFAIDTDYNREMTDIAPKLFYELLKAGKIDVAIERYRCLRQNKQISEKDQFTIIENLINACCNYDELETLDLFMETIMPLTEDLPPEKLAWRKKEWQKTIADYIDYMETRSDRYAYSRRNLWRNQYKDEAVHFKMDLEDYYSEQTFVNHLEMRKENEERQQRLAVKQEKVSYPKASAVITEQESNQKDEDKVYHFVGIVFPHGVQVYNYLTNEEDIKVGDHVVVPTSHGEAKVKVVSVTSCLRSAAPYSVDKAKYIMGKAEEND